MSHLLSIFALSFETQHPLKVTFCQISVTKNLFHSSLNRASRKLSSSKMLDPNSLESNSLVMETIQPSNSTRQSSPQKLSLYMKFNPNIELNPGSHQSPRAVTYDEPLKIKRDTREKSSPFPEKRLFFVRYLSSCLAVCNMFQL